MNVTTKAVLFLPVPSLKDYAKKHGFVTTGMRKAQLAELIDSIRHAIGDTVIDFEGNTGEVVSLIDYSDLPAGYEPHRTFTRAVTVRMENGETKTGPHFGFRVFASGKQAAEQNKTFRVTCKPTGDYPAERNWTVTAPNAGTAQERVCAENNLTWDHIHAGLVSTTAVDAAEQENIDCPPVCVHGNTADQGCLRTPCAEHIDNVHPIALEHAEIIGFEQNFFDGLISQGAAPEDALDITSGLRAVDAAWEDDSAETTRYDELLRKHAGTVPFVIRHDSTGRG